MTQNEQDLRNEIAQLKRRISAMKAVATRYRNQYRNQLIDQNTIR